ncbi:cysteine-rich DPF motif domain-containing protein 1 [Hemibagrus wyckioides]|uniref:cysteine-rich DPF motif domain-containing protein 1 n=1 Tax=Hemibagrus wyckioides TaxID=337641 RepID=UPI00266CD3EE|nr:cysteine-rich DPF motif domain-containing protein 1 [Hemibagrus wyckioides]XP_058273451.1 cysteine-rich DPF motif domain-containing protein 1 [Hemibagrus wyckioides]
MEDTEEAQTGTFTCELCELSTEYTFYGRKPPNTRAIGFLEDCYGMRDPFTPNKDKFLILGSKCSLCKKTVCVGTDCSIFYTKRFCLPCVRKNLEQFPEQIQIEIAKKKTAQKS